MVYRGSTAIIGIPLFFACAILRPASGCASTAFDPQIRIKSEFSASSNPFVAAPEPNERERPATEGP